MLKMPFDSDEAKQVNRNIFEQIYYSALESSMDLSRKREKHIKKYKELIKKGLSPETSEEELEKIKEEKENLKRI